MRVSATGEGHGVARSVELQVALPGGRLGASALRRTGEAAIFCVILALMVAAQAEASTFGTRYGK